MNLVLRGSISFPGKGTITKARGSFLQFFLLLSFFNAKKERERDSEREAQEGCHRGGRKGKTFSLSPLPTHPYPLVLPFSRSRLVLLRFFPCVQH